MSRASSAPLAASSVPPTIQALAQQANTQLTPTQLRLLEKQQEHAGLQALKEASGNLLEKVEELAKMGNVMADGGEAVGSVLRNWPQVFSILNLFGAATAPGTTSANPEDPNAVATSSEPLDEEAIAEREQPLPQLVRLAFGNGE